MGKSRKSGGSKRTPPPPGRSHTDFSTTDKFDKAAEALGAKGKASVLNALAKFEREWKASQTNEDLSPGFEFKQLHAVGGDYRLCQIRAGFDHWVSLMFLIGKNDAYWIHAWKKSKLNNTKEVTLAKSRAEQLWASLSKG